MNIGYMLTQHHLTHMLNEVEDPEPTHTAILSAPNRISRTVDLSGHCIQLVLHNNCAYRLHMWGSDIQGTHASTH